MESLSSYFKREEFACLCGCGQDTVDAVLYNVLYALRQRFGAQVHINSGNRCVAHNKNIGGSSSSQHILGKAADIVVSGIEPEKVYKYLTNRYPNKYGIGSYETFTHIDVRSTKARW